MAKHDQVIRNRVEELMKAKKTKSEIAKTLKAEGIKSKRTGKPLAEGSIAYYMQGNKKVRRSQGTAAQTLATANMPFRSVTNTNAVVSAIQALAMRLKKKDRLNLGLELLTGK